jgi:hypothetical protein
MVKISHIWLPVGRLLWTLSHNACTVLKKTCMWESYVPGFQPLVQKIIQVIQNFRHVTWNFPQAVHSKLVVETHRSWESKHRHCHATVFPNKFRTIASDVGNSADTGLTPIANAFTYPVCTSYSFLQESQTEKRQIHLIESVFGSGGSMTVWWRPD